MLGILEGEASCSAELMHAAAPESPCYHTWKCASPSQALRMVLQPVIHLVCTNYLKTVALSKLQLCLRLFFIDMCMVKDFHSLVLMGCGHLQRP